MEIPITTQEQDKIIMRGRRIRAIIAWYQIMLDNLLDEKYQDAIEDSTMITQMVQKLKEEQE